MDPDTQSTPSHIHILWEKLARELGDILDAHGVCAGVAYEVAVATGVTTVVGLSGPVGRYFDVWVCAPSGDLEQTRWEQDKASFPELLEHGKAIRLQKYELAAQDVIHSELWLRAKQTLLFVPLPFPAGHDQSVSPGGLCLLDPPDDALLDCADMETLAMYVTTFLDRAFLRQRADRQEVEFDIVYDLTNTLTSSLDLENIFSQLVDPVRRILNVETISVGLTEPATNDIVFVDLFLGPLFKQLPPIRLKQGQGIAGQVAATGEPLIVNNAYRDRRFFAKVDRDSGFRTDSLLCVPLKVEQRVIGVLEAINKQTGNFSENDLRLLQAIAGPLAAAIENARLHGDVLAEKRRVETIFTSMSEGMLTVTAEGIITAVNDSLLTMMGLEEGETLLGRPAGEAIVIRAGESFAAYMERGLSAGDDFPQLACELVQAGGGRVSVLVSGAPITDEEGEIGEMIFVFSDVTQIREVERMRDDFFHNIIHELRTPLATILMYARLLREGKAQDDREKADRFLGVIERESDRLQHMVRQMLQLAKLEAREIQRNSQPVSLNAIFDEMLPPLADRAMQKGLAFSRRVATDLPPVYGNEEMLYSVFKNLVDNAIKFTLSGTVKVEASVQDAHIVVLVGDEGIGFPEEAIPNLFKRFYRTQTAVERGIAGTGLGLYMAKEAVEKHDGEITVASVEGEGTTFTVRLPIAAE